jgi:hypothetical protein
MFVAPGFSIQRCHVLWVTPPRGPAHTGARRVGGGNNWPRGPPGLSLRARGIVTRLRCRLQSPAEPQPLPCPPQRALTAFCQPGIWESWRFFLTDFGGGRVSRKHVTPRDVSVFSGVPLNSAIPEAELPLWRGAGGGGVLADTRRPSAAGDGVPPSLQIPPHTHILLARSPAPYSPFRLRAHPPTAFSGPMARPPPSPPRPPPSHMHAGWMVSATKTPTSSAPSQDSPF